MTGTLAARSRPGAPGAPGTGPRTRHPDVVFAFSRLSWAAAWRRGLYMAEDRLACSLLDSERVGRLLVCSHPRNRVVRVLRRLGADRRAPFPSGGGAALAEPTWWWRRDDPVTVRGVERAYASYERALVRAVRRHGLERPAVITGSPLLAGFCELGWASSVTWYAIDDWAEHPAYARWRQVHLEAYERIRTRGHRVAAVTEPLLERLAPSGPTKVVPNGLEPAEWTAPAPGPAPLARLPRPLYVYVGTIDQRIDVAWIGQLAQAETDATILFLGHVAAPEHVAPLERLPNVRIHPPVDRRQVAAVVRCADVGLLPHRVTRLTTAMSPLKLLEYCAGGIPVVATDMPAVRALRAERVTLVPEGGDFVAGARAALAAGRAPEDERMRFLRENSWRSRHELILDLALS